MMLDNNEHPKPRLAAIFSSRSDEWETPQELFDALDREFNFTIDVCATDTNAKCSNYYSPVEDSLSQVWDGVCWCNPPYGRQIRKWLKKAYDAAKFGATVVLLVPSRTDTAWWWDYARYGEIRFLRGRLKFGHYRKNGKQKTNGATFPSAIVIFKPDVKERDSGCFHWDEWRKDAA